MAMTPEEKNKFEMMERRLNEIERVTNVSFVAELTRRVFGALTVSDLPNIKLSDLSDVSNTDSASTGQVLKKTATTWQAGTDNT